MSPGNPASAFSHASGSQGLALKTARRPAPRRPGRRELGRQNQNQYQLPLASLGGLIKYSQSHYFQNNCLTAFEKYTSHQKCCYLPSNGRGDFMRKQHKSFGDDEMNLLTSSSQILQCGPFLGLRRSLNFGQTRSLCSNYYFDY